MYYVQMRREHENGKTLYNPQALIINYKFLPLTVSNAINIIIIIIIIIIIGSIESAIESKQEGILFPTKVSIDSILSRYQLTFPPKSSLE